MAEPLYSETVREMADNVRPKNPGMAFAMDIIAVYSDALRLNGEAMVLAHGLVEAMVEQVDMPEPLLRRFSYEARKIRDLMEEVSVLYDKSRIEMAGVSNLPEGAEFFPQGGLFRDL